MTTWVQEFAITYTGLSNTSAGNANAGGTGLTDEVTASGGIGSWSVGAGGTGYTTAPSWGITDATGTGAVASTSVSAGAVTHINVSVPGVDYTAPTGNPTGGGGTGATGGAITKGIWQIVSGKLTSTGFISSGYYNQLDRPAPTINQRIVSVVPIASSATSHQTQFRINNNFKTMYSFNFSGTALDVYSYQYGVATRIGSSQTFSQPATNDVISIDASVVGFNPTTLACTVTDTTTSTVLATFTATDSTSALQTPGNYGIGANQTRANVTSLTFYESPGINVSPASANLNTTASVVVTQQGGTNYTPGTPGSPTFSIAGGGASITSQVVNSTTQATLQIATGATAAAATITDPLNSFTAGFTLAAMNVPEPVATVTGASVSLACSAATGGSGTITYQMYRSQISGFTSTSQATAVGTSSTSPQTVTDTPPWSPNPYYYKLYATDSAATPQSVFSNQAVVVTTNRTLKFLGIGDSRMLGSHAVNLTGGWLPVIGNAIESSSKGQISCSVNNQGVSGVTSAYWLSGVGSNIAAAIAAFGTITSDSAAFYLIGANDAKNGTYTPVGTFTSNVENTVNALLTAGFTRVYLIPEWYIVPVYPSVSGEWDEQSDYYIQQYNAALPSVCAATNPAYVQVLDDGAYSYFAANPGQLVDGTHPGDPGYAAKAAMSLPLVMEQFGLISTGTVGFNARLSLS